MTKSNRWKNFPLPPNWEQKYDPKSKLNYYIDHSMKQATWIDPRSWYYSNSQNSTGQCGASLELRIDTASDAYENLRESAGGPERNDPVKLSCAAKTDLIVNEFLNEEYDPKHDRLHRRRKHSSLNSRKSSSRKEPGRSLKAQSFSPSPSAVVTSTMRFQRQPFNPESHRDTVSVDDGLMEKKNDSVSILPSKSESRIEKKSTDYLKSVPETEATNQFPAHSNLEPKSDKTGKSKSCDSRIVDEGEAKNEESRELKESNKSSRSLTQSSLLIHAIGPNRSLLIHRKPAQGPNPAFHKGHDSTLAKGHNSSLLLKNQCNPLSAT